MIGDPLISVVIPAYNEARAIEGLAVRVGEALSKHRWEILFVNDGSSDATAEVIDRMAAANERIKGSHLSRNFGHQAAVLAGIRHANGDAVIVMDADLQDDPAALPRLVAKWREGFKVVYVVRVGRKEGPWRRLLFYAFYRLLNAMTGSTMPNDAGNFGLIDRRIGLLVSESPERDRYYAGLRHWVGFRQVGVEVERGERYDGVPRVSSAGLVSLAKSAIFSFSSVPLRMFYALAAVSAAVLFGLGGFTLYHKVVTGLAIPGWTSTIMTACFFGALNALGIAVLGEYVTRIYDQVRGRAPFIVDRTVNLNRDAASSGSER